MAGQIIRLLDSIIEQRGRGDPLLVLTTRAKLIFKGVNPDRFNGESLDDPAVIAKVRLIAAEFGVNV